MSKLQTLCSEALARDPARPAIEFEGRWYNWGNLATVASSVANLLEASGIGVDAPVAFVPRNQPESFAVLFGLIASGRTIKMIYAFQSAEGIARDIEKLKPSAIILHAQDFAPELEQILSDGGLAAILLDEMAAVAAPDYAIAKRDALKRIGPKDPQIEILTSGTTGPPKHFPIPYLLIEQHFISSALAKQQGDDAELAPPFLLYFPLGNISGLYSTLPMLIRGQRVVLLERFSLQHWLDYVIRYRPTHSGLPPSFVQQVIDAGIANEDLASIKAMGVGAAPLDPGVQQAFEDHYGIPILLSYGATEFAGPVAMMTPELHVRWGREKIGTVGRAIPGAKLRVVDAESGERLNANEPGILEVVSPRLGPDWIRTSDLATIDGDGFLFLHGRADGAIMRGGFKVLPESIERALMLHPDISEAAVTAAPDTRLGQVPAAVIRLRPGAKVIEVSSLKSHLRQHLPATHIPTKWRFCEDLPRTNSLKIDRVALSRMFDSSR
jgi:long-chain acyl-CoA synthetase